MTMEMQATLVLNWLDKRIKWNPSDHGNLTRLVLSEYKIRRFWLPQIQIKAV